MARRFEYVTGSTGSPTNVTGAVPFPRVGAFQPLYGGGDDAFVTKLNAAGCATGNIGNRLDRIHG